jgi:hypothetical protein
MRANKYVVMILAASGLVGCGVPEDGELAESQEQVVEEAYIEEVGSVSQGLATWRADQVAEITPSTGNWGDWRQKIYCSPGMYAIGYKMRVESSQGLGDDTALNSVILLCSSGSTTEEIQSYEGIWGNWRDMAQCSGGHLIGARLRVESPQGGGDDSGATDAEFSCSNSGTIHAPGGMAWGNWENWNTCPANSAICGLSIRYESGQGGGDDTAMNGIQLYCCAK